jgi:hypothetical protein
MKVKVIYQKTIEDIQTVAVEEIGRELTDDEIQAIEDTVAANINWYDAVADAINGKILVE